MITLNKNSIITIDDIIETINKSPIFKYFDVSKIYATNLDITNIK